MVFITDEKDIVIDGKDKYIIKGDSKEIEKIPIEKYTRIVLWPVPGKTANF